MKILVLDAIGWGQPLDVYEALVTSLGSPPWHGYNLNALIDSVVWHDCNDVKPPYVIQIHNLSSASSLVIQEVTALRNALKRSRAEHVLRQGSDVDASIEFV